jgi:hypothetical protein
LAYNILLFKFLNTKLQTQFRKKPNTALESKAAFVHLNSIVHAIPVNESFAFLTPTVNNYFGSPTCFLSWLGRSHKNSPSYQHHDNHIFLQFNSNKFLADNDIAKILTIFIISRLVVFVVCSLDIFMYSNRLRYVPN